MDARLGSPSWPTSQAVRPHQRVLCVDDDPHVSDAIARRLRPFEIEVIRAYSGMQGYWQMVTEYPDAVVIDLAMPNGSGKELVECAMRNQMTTYIPLIVLTGDCDQATETSLFRMGVSGFLRKPLASEQLLWELGHHIDLCDRAQRVACAVQPPQLSVWRPTA